MLWTILADDVAPKISDWIHTGGPIMSWGFAIWYAWYTTTKTIPDQNKQHAQTIQRLVDEFRNEAKEQRELERQRFQQMAEALTNITGAVHELTDKIGSHIHK